MGCERRKGKREKEGTRPVGSGQTNIQIKSKKKTLFARKQLCIQKKSKKPGNKLQNK